MPYIHTLQDLSFNTAAQVGAPDYGLLYIGMGDGGVSDKNVFRSDLTHRLDSVYGSIAFFLFKILNLLYNRLIT